MSMSSSAYSSIVRSVRHNTPGSDDTEADVRFSRYIVARLLAYLKPHKAKMTAAFAAMLLVTGLSLWIPS